MLDQAEETCAEAGAEVEGGATRLPATAWNADLMYNKGRKCE